MFFKRLIFPETHQLTPATKIAGHLIGYFRARGFEAPNESCLGRTFGRFGEAQ